MNTYTIWIRAKGILLCLLLITFWAKSQSQKTQLTNLDARNSLIVTYNQSGGTNIVSITNIPEAIVKLDTVLQSNIVVNEVPIGRVYNRVAIPNEEYRYDSAYKTSLIIEYQSAVAFNFLDFWIKRNDILFYEVSYNGYMQPLKTFDEKTKQPIFSIKSPGPGKYEFIIFSVKKFGDPTKEIAVTL